MAWIVAYGIVCCISDPDAFVSTGFATGASLSCSSNANVGVKGVGKVPPASWMVADG